ncbi:methyltransferase [Fusarium albosuccineum]|uniref:Methyltransferase n=1 Tax=Fusarium albosuccineum TaxID=1237068 RepID=A0A8H4LKR1_9HYPO|nr:methyltransferase [Fusarium albosuccineum]
MSDDKYLFNETNSEVERLRKQHAWFQRCLNDRIVFAPVPLDKEGLKVLDVGCADGILLRDLRKQVSPSAQLVGVDLMKDFLPSSPQDNITYDTYDVCEPPTGELAGTFDFTHVRYVLPATARVGYQTAVNNLAATLAPGGWLQVQEMDLDPEQRGVGPAYHDVIRVFSGIFDKVGIGARFPTKLGDAFKAAGLENVKVQTIDLPMGKALGEDEDTRYSWEPFILTVPSVMQTAKSLGADIPESTYDNLVERFKKEVQEQGSMFKSFLVTGQKPA